MKKNFDYHGLIGEGNPLLRYPQLLEAAIDEFSQKKFEDASLNDILKKADMSKGSLYHHFGDKFGLYLALMDIIIKKKVSFFVPFLQKREDSGDFFDTVRDVIRGTSDFMFADERLHHLFNRNMEAGKELTEQLIQYFPYNYGAWFHKLICSAIESGQIDKKYSPEFIVKILEIMFSNVHKLLPQQVTPEQAIEAIDQMVTMMQYGIAAKKEDS
ncbi:TetR/AcrR family transcriptional regulator [Mobilitalea sibirica]|uniref:TetR/AcrR family transcriptional regulator n=1 Tax=Mobilitalea sibirica TaxID=1462919 RepID=A0A8J7H5T6_9FIRM|nr:TetR/AcrR family transcriptional regulator [Mobilitalea sibirica]MBH1941834.1 TetR/AcrR family transcriptional regulator [Mobilitalea sibirica]